MARTFVKLLTGLSQKYQQKVVVLVDEYDKPIINHLGKGEEGLKIARQNRDLLKNFFGVLKGGQVAASLRFVFITGISKFSRVSIFSDLNNLQDLTVHAGYADMLGYTQEELEQYFGDRIAEFAQKQKTSADDVLQKLREWYNGYVTIQDFDGALYSLGYPNQEVKTSFLNYLYHDLVKISGTT